MTTTNPGAPEASLDWCHPCLKLEPRPDLYHQICGECGHVYVTSEDLEYAYIRQCCALNLPVEAMIVDDIEDCPKCGHSF